MQPQRRLLFVDHSPDRRKSLGEWLRPQQGQWEMTLVSHWKEALSLLETQTCDAVVAEDLGLLEQVQQQFSQVVRILLSGGPTPEWLRSVSIVHQVLSYPCDLGLLRVAVERACRLKALLVDETVRRTVGSLGELPALPRIYEALALAVTKEGTSARDVARLVEQDLAISAKVLQLVNSAFFGLLQPITGIQSAVSYLGLEVIKNLVLYTGVFRSFECGLRVPGFSQEALQEHSQKTTQIAGQLPVGKAHRETALAAALLHDVGKLVLASKMPGRFARFLSEARAQGRPLYEVEQEMAGVTHAGIGAYLLGMWGLPFAIVEAVAYHHTPAAVPYVQFDALAAVHVADHLAHQAAPGDGEVAPKLDEAFLETLGFQH